MFRPPPHKIYVCPPPLYLRQAFGDALSVGQLHGPVKMAATAGEEPAKAPLGGGLGGLVGRQRRAVGADTGQGPLVGQIHQVR